MNHKLDDMSNHFMEIINLLKENEKEVLDLKEKVLSSEKNIKDLANINVTLSENNAILVNNDKALQTEIRRLEDKVNGIILDEENANRSGRTNVLSDEDVEYVKQLRRDGLTLRKIGEIVDVSHTTIANSLKRELVNKDNRFTKTDDVGFKGIHLDPANDLTVGKHEIRKSNLFNKDDISDKVESNLGWDDLK